MKETLQEICPTDVGQSENFVSSQFISLVVTKGSLNYLLLYHFHVFCCNDFGQQIKFSYIKSSNRETIFTTYKLNLYIYIYI